MIRYYDNLLWFVAAAISELAQFIINCLLNPTEIQLWKLELMLLHSNQDGAELRPPVSCDPNGEISGFPPLTRSIVSGVLGGRIMRRRGPHTPAADICVSVAQSMHDSEPSVTRRAR